MGFDIQYSKFGTIAVRAALIGVMSTIVLPLAVQSQESASPARQVVNRESGGSTVKADDGFDLWFDAWGEGPAIIFLVRTPNENRAYAEALADRYRVVLFENRITALYGKVAAEQSDDASAPNEHLAGRNLDWDPSGDDPIDRHIADLHTIADAAGVGTFVLAGYSGTARVAAFLATYSDRAIGLIAGGFNILGSQDYWIGYIAGAKAAALSDPDTPETLKALTSLNEQQIMLEHTRDADAAFGTLPGPKIVWIGSQDGEPDDELMASYFSGARTAHRIRSLKAEY